MGIDDCARKRICGCGYKTCCEGKVVAASMWGKLKTVTQMVAIIVAMLLLPIQNTFLGVHPKLISDILIWISVVFTIISGVDYIAKNWNLMEMK